MLNGCPIEVSSLLAHGKRSVLLNGVLYVSPAMWELMRDTTPDELERLLRAIEVVNMGSFNPLASLPMTPGPR